MRDTDFFVPEGKLDRFAGCGIFTDPQRGTKTRMDQDGAASAYATPPVFPSGAGGLVSTVDDYLAFARMLLKGGVHESRRLLRTESVREMTKDQLRPEQKAASSFFPGVFGTSWVNDPGRDLVAIVMTQSPDFLFSGGLEAFWRGVYAAVDE